MTSACAATHPYLDDKDIRECPKCGNNTEVEVIRQDGHNEPEDITCAHCGETIATVRASLVRTYLVEQRDTEGVG